MKRAVVSLAAWLVTALAFGVGTVAAEDVRIGTVFPLTGNMAFGGNEGFMGTEIAREIVNERGGRSAGAEVLYAETLCFV